MEKAQMNRLVWLVMFAVCLLADRTLTASAQDRLVAVVGRPGRIELSRGRERICDLRAGLYDSRWNAADARMDTRGAGSESMHPLRIAVPGGGTVRGEAKIAADSGNLRAEYVFEPDQDVRLNSLHVVANFKIPTLADGRWIADGRSGVFPKDFGETQLFSGNVRSLKLELPAGTRFEIAFPSPTAVLLQDNRQWGPSFVIRIIYASSSQPFKKGVPAKIEFTLSAPGGVAVEHDNLVTIVADKNWIPLQLDLDIVPGSALDFSTMGLQDAPAGKHGWLRANTDGTFSFQQQPDKPVRFYGVNLCFSAQYLAHNVSDLLAERLARLGYNAVRLHHYEGELTDRAADHTRLNAEKLDQLDYLIAALIKRGIFVTTDLYVSRPVDVARLVPSFQASRRDSMNSFKVLAVINPQAYENWKAFSRNLLTHVNPYTQRSYAAEPALAWLSLINEGNLGNYMQLIRDIPDYKVAWNRWLVEEYGGRDALAKAWRDLLKADEDPDRGTVVLEGSINDRHERGRDTIRFLAQVEKDFLERAVKFLREEIGTHALVTNMNAWTNPVTTQLIRSEMDYVDDHFYVDHPQFIERPWQLPSRCPNTSPIAGGASGGRHVTFTRLFDKPFTVTEYNYSAPGRYRGVGGILTGSMGAIQGWGAIWRFAYAHNRDVVAEPGRLDYFNMATDPLSQAAERASICLFLRGDMRPAPHSVTVAMTTRDLTEPPVRIPSVAPSWHWAAWVTRVGTSLVQDPATQLRQDLVLPLGWVTPASAYVRDKVADVGDPYQISSDRTVELLRRAGILSQDNTTDPGKNVLQCETGEITIDAPHDVMTIDTPRTAGGFAPAGERIRTTHGVEIAVQDSDATVWVSALDDQPITASKRLLVTHLTDLQNTGIVYAERSRQTLLQWGQLPHLVRAGKAEVGIQLAQADAYQVWALGTNGKRLAEVASQVSAGTLTFTADVAGFGDCGAIVCYEIVRR
jgi:hypothetical protein